MAAMNETMRAAFEAGSGVAPATLKGTLATVCVGVALLVCAWVIAQLACAWRDEEISSGEAVMGMARTAVLTLLLIYVIV